MRQIAILGVVMSPLIKVLDTNVYVYECNAYDLLMAHRGLHVNGRNVQVGGFFFSESA